MQRLSQFEPALVGGVAAGWATAHSDIELDLVAATGKSVEMALLNAGVDYRTMNADDDGPQRIHVDTPEGGLRLTVRTPEEARQRPRRDRHGTEIVRLTRTELVELLGAELPLEPTRRVEREIGQDGIGACPLHSWRFQDAGTLVKPAVLRRGLQHRVSRH